MSPDLLLVYLMRWLHIAAAILAVGAPFFVRFILNPAADKSLEDVQHQKLREAINAQWRIVVYILIAVFLITGFYNYLVPVRINGVLITSRWRDWPKEQQATYHMIMGFKILAAFGIFFLASALAGRSKTFAPIRAKRKLFLTLLLVFAGIVLTCATMLRFLPNIHG